MSGACERCGDYLGPLIAREASFCLLSALRSLITCSTTTAEHAYSQDMKLSCDYNMPRFDTTCSESP